MPMRNCTGLTILVPAMGSAQMKFVSWYTWSFPKRDELTKCQWKDGLSISCLVPSFRANPPGSESYCPACSVHTHRQESSRWVQGLAGERAGGSGLTLRCWSWFLVSSKADQLNCTDFWQELPRAWGTELLEPVRASLILESPWSSSELHQWLARRTFTKSG